MTAITFALPDESRDFLHLLRHPGAAGSAGHSVVLGNLGRHELLVVHTGMGAARTRERLVRLFDEEPVSRIVSAGYAGGLDPRLPAGAIFLAENQSSPELLAAACAALGERAVIGGLASSAAVLETLEAKAAFARRTGAAAVDMETATIAALCRERGVPHLSLRVISDTAREELAVPFSVCFDPLRQRPRPLALVRFLLRHPSRIGRFARFVGAVTHARAGLTGALIAVLERLEPTGDALPATTPSHFSVTPSR